VDFGARTWRQLLSVHLDQHATADVISFVPLLQPLVAKDGLSSAWSQLVFQRSNSRAYEL